MLSNGVLCTVHTFVSRNFPHSFYQKQTFAITYVGLRQNHEVRDATGEERTQRQKRNKLCATRNLRSVVGKFDTNIPIDISRSGT